MNSINNDFSARVVLNAMALPWQTSRSPGVHRRMIERDEGAVARATSLVRYDADAAFAAHQHDLGEEILVLDGVLSDQHGDYEAGTYIKNPPGSRHTPSSARGCTLLVKARHLDARDSVRIVVDTRRAAWFRGLVPGLSVLPLAQFGQQHTAMVRWAPETYFNPHRHYGGEEIYVVDGIFEDENGLYPAGTWIRSPHLSQHRPFSKTGCLIFVKTGHLPDYHPCQALAR